MGSASDSNGSFGDESSLDFSNSHDSEEEPFFRGTEVDAIQEKELHAGITNIRNRLTSQMLSCWLFFE